MIGRLELLRLRRSHRPRVAVLALLLFLGLMLLGFYTYAERRTGGRAEFRYTFENRSYFNGLTFALYAFYFASTLLLPVFVAVEGGAQIAGDRVSGVLRLLLTRPITRTRLFTVKTALAAAWAVLLAGGLLAMALLVGLFAVGWGDLDLYPGVLRMTASRQHLEQGEALRRFLFAWPAASLSLFAPLTFSILVASWSRSAVNAIGTSVALYLVLHVVAEIHFFEDLRPWLFTSDMGYWRAMFQERIPWEEVAGHAARLGGFSLAFLALALWRFRTREER